MGDIPGNTGTTVTFNSIQGSQFSSARVSTTAGSAVTIMAFGGMAVSAISEVMGQNTAFQSNPAILASADNRSYLADNNIFAAKFGDTVIVMPLDQVTDEAISEALQLSVADVEVEALGVQGSFNLQDPVTAMQIAREVQTAALFNKAVELLDADVKTEVAAQVAEKALENNIQVDGLEAFITSEINGGALAGIIAATEIDGKVGNSDPDKT